MNFISKDFQFVFVLFMETFNSTRAAIYPFYSCTRNDDFPLTPATRDQSAPNPLRSATFKCKRPSIRNNSAQEQTYSI